MKIDRDTCTFIGPLGWHRSWLMLSGVSLLLGSFCVGSAVAQLRLSPETPAVRVAKQASQALPDRVTGQKKSAQADGVQAESTEVTELIKKALGDGSAAQADAGAANKGSQQAPGPSKEMIDQINAIRRQMGGGVADQLDGLFDDSDQGREQLQHEFDRELNDLFAGPRAVQEQASVSSQVSRNNASRLCQALRNGARELDSVAADLEDAELYQAADKIRASAANLRSEARARAGASSRIDNSQQPGRAVSNWTRSAESPDAATKRPDLRPNMRSNLGPNLRSGLPAAGLDPKIRPRQ